MPLVPFPLPPARVEYIELSVRMTKGDRTRWFMVRIRHYQDEPRREFRGLIQFDGYHHRSLTTTDLLQIMTFRIQCEGEIRELEKDGWVQVAEPTPRRRS
jgi:hypothetical protein